MKHSSVAEQQSVEVIGLHAASAETPKPAIPYRPDIDGLRAIAVLAVILFHSGLGAPGGFVGVDIFFVISGYLITSILLVEMESPGYRLLSFWERRIRRILPALFTMLLGCTALGLVFLLPRDLLLLVESAAAAAFFCSNFLFIQTGYFADAAQSQPLLHTWSLGIEEQFYLLYPLVLYVLCRRFKKHLVPILTIAAIGSFGLAVVLLAKLHHSVAFFILPTRGWELLCGAILACGALKPIRQRAAREATALAGLTAIIISIWLYGPDAAFPGPAALLPCFGTAALIWAGEGGGAPAVATRIVGCRPLVAIGLISYSLYVWHWPALYLLNYLSNGTARLGSIALALLASAAIAYASYRYIERPFRRRRNEGRWQPLVGGAAVSMLAVLAIYVAISGTLGLPGRFRPDVLRTAAARNDQDLDVRTRCANRTVTDIAQSGLCRVGEGDGKPDFVVWGDSHALALFPVFDMLAKKHGLNGRFGAYTGCPPLLDVMVGSDPQRPCVEFNAAMARALKENPAEWVILVARWPVYVWGYVPGSVERDAAPYAFDRETRALSPAEAERAITRGLERSLAALPPKTRLVWVDGAPGALQDVPEALAKESAFPWISPAWRLPAESARRRESVVRRVAESRIGHGVDMVLSLTDRLCGGEYCQADHEGMPLYADNTHFTVRGALDLAPFFEPMFAQIGKRTE